MILGDLIHLPVLDAAGDRVGRVTDVRFVLDGAAKAPLADARLFGFVVSPHTKGSYWGYERGEERGPAPIGTFLRWRHRGTFLVPWASIERVDADAIHLVEGYRRLDPTL